MDLQSQLAELKYDYVRIQNDLEKRESTGNATDMLENQLVQLEEEIKKVRDQLNQE
ncbi:SE1832 family protein [Mammaliicoccus stepanovicii]|uniref:DNA repair/chromosome segregation ATPase n=1 Tax=Mammaliicoccus stepanovicii TaxID=643214 RepID=A0A239YIV1_9STAP|nr:SE1832 family protein [Mammaliicoccus stepanovicii]GGI40989.1 hypothetical protein GCM10010896_11120 [Mammaliicoccus stepanovicii]SNV59059.1 DNA repair/chromosome segregation ATPase [Mammaliicoccus stepanovicii]